jgi:hypothetical protein
MVQAWCAPAVERVESPGGMRRRALRPTPRADPAPLAGPGAHGRLRRLALGAWRRGGALGPAGMPGRGRRPRPTRVAQARRPRATPVAPGLLAAAFRHGRHRRLCLAGRGRSVACAVCTQGHEEAWGTDGPGAWQRLTQGAGGRLLGPWRAGGVAVGKALEGDAAWGHERVPHQGVGGAAPVMRGQGSSALEGRKARRDAVGRAHVGGAAAGCQGGAPRALGRVARRPAAQDVAHERRSCVLQPLRDVGKGVVQGPGHAGGAPHGGAAQALAVCAAWRQGAPRRVLGAEGGSVSRCVRRRSPWRAAALGASVARLGGHAWRSVATGSGGTGKSPRPSW